MSPRSRRRFFRIFLPLFILGLLFCPCRGFAQWIEPFLAAEVSCCDHCGKGDRQSKSSRESVPNCDCEVGCCQSYVIPDGKETQALFSSVLLGFNPAVHASVSGPVGIPCLTELVSAPPDGLYSGALLPNLISLRL